jgi:hypothetical protein
MTLEKQMYDGDLANQVLENPIFQQVFSDIETELVGEWKSSKSVAERESLHLDLRTLGKIKQRLVTTLETGKLARREVERKRSLLEKLVTQRQYE